MTRLRVSLAGHRLGRRARWAVPVAAGGRRRGVIAGTAVAGAQTRADAARPQRGPAAHRHAARDGPGPMTATVQVDREPGPARPARLAGTARRRYRCCPGRTPSTSGSPTPPTVRVSEPVQLGESDLRRDGRRSGCGTARPRPRPISAARRGQIRPLRPDALPNLKTRRQVLTGRPPPAGQERQREGPAARRTEAHPAPVTVTRRQVRVRCAGAGSPGSRCPARLPSPAEAARQILAALGPTTTVSVQRNVIVAGQAAYQLSLAPKDTGSLVGRISDRGRRQPLLPAARPGLRPRRDQPGVQRRLHLADVRRPGGVELHLHPAPGAKVKTQQLPARRDRSAFGPFGLLSRRSRRRIVTAGTLPAFRRWVPAHAARVGRARGRVGSGTAMNRPRQLKPGRERQPVLHPGRGLGTPPTRSPAAGRRGAVHQATAPAARPTGRRQGLAVGAGAAVRAAEGRRQQPDEGRRSAGLTRDAQQGRAESRHRTGIGAAGPHPADARCTLLNAATPVHGAWGSGRLLRTSLLSILITRTGACWSAPFTPAVLYADAATVK